ncbi:MAG: hypothetical protein ABSG76_10845 [Xanthobacteraceae bacterium]
MSAWSWPATQGDAVLGHQPPASRGLKRHWPTSAAHPRQGGTKTEQPATAEFRSEPPPRSQYPAEDEDRIIAGQSSPGT